MIKVNMKIILKRRDRFGVIYYYPQCPLSTFILKFAKRKVFHEADIKFMEKEGFLVIAKDT